VTTAWLSLHCATPLFDRYIALQNWRPAAVQHSFTTNIFKSLCPYLDYLVQILVTRFKINFDCGCVWLFGCGSKSVDVGLDCAAHRLYACDTTAPLQLQYAACGVIRAYVTRLSGERKINRRMKVKLRAPLHVRLTTWRCRRSRNTSACSWPTSPPNCRYTERLSSQRPSACQHMLYTRAHNRDCENQQKAVQIIMRWKLVINEKRTRLQY